jgi:hypothetical protein
MASYGMGLAIVRGRAAYGLGGSKLSSPIDTFRIDAMRSCASLHVSKAHQALALQS